MRHQHHINLACRKGKLSVGDLVSPLLQSAVYQDALAVYLQAVAAAGDALIGAVKQSFMLLPPFCSIRYLPSMKSFVVRCGAAGTHVRQSVTFYYCTTACPKAQCVFLKLLSH